MSEGAGINFSPNYKGLCITNSGTAYHRREPFVWGFVKCYDRTMSWKQKTRLRELTWVSLLFDE